MGEEARGLDAQPPTIIHDVPHDLLERILLRVRTPVSLIRAAATCKPWRRLIAGNGFLRRFCRLNGPHILGHYYCYYKRCMPDFVPLAVPAACKPAIDPLRVSLHFLPDKFTSPVPPVLHDMPGTKKGDSTSVQCLAMFLLDANPGETETGTGIHMSNFRLLYVHLVHYCNIDIKIVQAYVSSLQETTVGSG